MNKEELIKEYDEKAKALRDEFIAKLEDYKKEFKLTYPKHEETLYYISNASANICDIYFFDNDNFSKNVFEHGLYFKTKEEAEQHLKERKLLFKLHQWAKIKNGDWEPDWSDYSNNKFLIYYDGEDGLLRISAGSISNTLSSLPTLKTREIAQECIDIFGDEIKEVLC
jgi:hypothetical protein|nr:MAG TPA: hypothetical protein [Caudoviricetes sp.]